MGRPTAVLGLGNVLMKDDALGPYVIQRLLATWSFPPDVAVEDLGTPGLDLQPYLADREALIVVDTVRADGPPGEIRLYRKDDLLRHAPQPRTSPHDPGLKEALLARQLAGNDPAEVLLVGVIPDDVGSGIGLTPAIRESLVAAEAEVVRELRRLGHAIEPLETPSAPDIWWEKPAGNTGV